MAVSELFTLSRLNIDSAGGTDFNIDQIEDCRLGPGIEPLLLRGAGELDDSFGANMRVAPVISVTTTNIKTVLDAVGILGLKISVGAGDTGANLYFSQYDEGAARKDGANHIKLTVTEGLLVPRMITASQGQGPATMTLDLIATFDGTNDPIAIATSQALPSGIAASEAFVLGPVKMNNVDLDGVQSLRIDFGLNVIVRDGDGDVYPTFCAIGTRRTSLIIGTSKASYLATMGISGEAVDATDVIAWLRKVAEGANCVAEATAEHISFTVDEGQNVPADSSFTEGMPADMMFQVVPTWDGANDVLVLDTTAAIT